MSFNVHQYFSDHTNPEFWRIKFQNILGDKAKISFLIVDHINSDQYNLRFKLGLRHNNLINIRNVNYPGALSFWGSPPLSSYKSEKTQTYDTYYCLYPHYEHQKSGIYPMQKSQHWNIVNQYLNPRSSIIDITCTIYSMFRQDQLPCPQDDKELSQRMTKHFENIKIFFNNFFLSGVYLSPVSKILQEQLQDWSINPEEVYTKMVSDVDQKKTTSLLLFTQPPARGPIDPIDPGLIELSDSHTDSDSESEWVQLDPYKPADPHPSIYKYPCQFF